MLHVFCNSSYMMYMFCSSVYVHTDIPMFFSLFIQLIGVGGGGTSRSLVLAAYYFF